jgi:hypothetical protein
MDNGAPGKPKEGTGKNNPDASSGKGDSANKSSEEKGSSKDVRGGANQGDPNDPNKKPTDAKNPQEAQVKEKGQPDKDATTRAPGSGDLKPDAQDQNARDPLQGGPGDPEYLKKAAELQLENIRDLVKKQPDILDKAGMKPEDLDKYYAAKQRQIEDYARQAREKAEAAAKDPRPPEKSAGPFGNLAAKPPKPEDLKTGTTNRPGAGAPPPEFRDMYYKKFTQPSKNP